MNKENVIIIPVHNGLQLLNKCFEKVIEKTKNPKIIIVNDASDEATTRWINNKAKGKECVVITNQHNLGFTASVNKGIELALKIYDFSVLCILNSDTEIVTQNWFDKVKKHMLAENNIGCAGVLSNNATHHSLTALNGKIFEPLAHDNINNYIKRISENRAVPCNLINGFCYFIRKEIINILGLMDDKEFPHYGSEDDYSLRAVSIGFKNVICDNVFIYHHECQSYTHRRRLQLLQHSVPALKNRWGAEYVGISFQEACSVLNYLKVKEKYPF